jgi:pimeloyl-ACP methyl ester carboxylesterase
MKTRNVWLASTLAAAIALGIGLEARRGGAAPSVAPVMSAATRVRYEVAKVDGVDVFYRDAGPKNAPTVLLLHGFPTSSQMFRDLIPRLADKYRVIAPDYPGYGYSAAPDRSKFAYTFDNYANVVDKLTEQIGVKRFALYVMDYGAPVGYRIAAKHPERVSAIVVQNGNAYTEGLREFWQPLKAYWADGKPAQREALRAGLTLAATKSQYLEGVRDPARIDPDNWIHDQALLDRPGIDEIMLDLFKDYGSNVELYPQFQAFFRARRPPTLIVWGKNDVIFPAEGAEPYLRDLPDAELHLLDTGHFALEDKGREIAELMLDFLGRKL